MASFIFDQVKTLLATNAIKLVDNDGTYVLALLDNTILDAKSTYSSKTKWSDISTYEISSVTGYNSVTYEQRSLTNMSGETITDAGGSCDDGLPDYKVSAQNIVYNVSTIDADCAVIMRKNISGDNDLVVALDLRSNNTKISSNMGVFTVRLDSSSGGYLIVK